MATVGINPDSRVSKKKQALVLQEKQMHLDPAVTLEPARKKLTTLETQRILSVFDEMIKKCLIVAALPTLLEKKEEYAIPLGRDLITQLEHYGTLKSELDQLSARMDAVLGRRLNRRHEEAEFEKAQTVFSDDFWTRPRSSASGGLEQSSAASGVDGGESNKEFTEEEIMEFSKNQEEIMARINELASQIELATRCILRCFRSNPTAVTVVIGDGLTAQHPPPSGTAGHRGSLSVRRGPGESLLLLRLQEMREIMLLRLMTTPNERDERLAYLHDISERERANAGQVEKLEAELATCIEHKDEQIKTKNETVRRLQSDIHHIEKFSEENIKRIKSEADKQKTSDERNSEGKRQKLTQDLGQLRAQMNGLMNDHKDSERSLRGRKFKTESELESKLQKYDLDMGDNQAQYEEVDADYTEEKKQLNELEERFNTLSAEYAIIMEERRIAQERREAAEREMQLLIKAATTIQAFWRSFKVRKALRGKRKGGGSGKGKKKGKK